MTPSNLLVVDLETRPDTAILSADHDPSAFPKPIQHEIVTLGFLLARIERDLPVTLSADALATMTRAVDA